MVLDRCLVFHYSGSGVAVISSHFLEQLRLYFPPLALRIPFPLLLAPSPVEGCHSFIFPLPGVVWSRT